MKESTCVDKIDKNMDKKSLKAMERKIKNLELELKLEKKKAELQKLEFEKEKEELLEKMQF